MLDVMVKQGGVDYSARVMRGDTPRPRTLRYRPQSVGWLADRDRRAREWGPAPTNRVDCGTPIVDVIRAPTDYRYKPFPYILYFRDTVGEKFKA